MTTIHPSRRFHGFLNPGRSKPHNQVVRSIRAWRERERVDPYITRAARNNNVLFLVNYFLRDCLERGLADWSIHSYRHDLYKLVKFIGDKKLRRLKRDSIYSFLMQDQNRQRKYRYITSFRAFGKYLGRNGVDNPLMSLQTPKRVSRIPTVLSVEEITDLINAPLIKLIQYWALMSFLYSTGCRESEAVWVKNSDVNLDTGQVVVTGKGQKQRIVFLNPRTKKALFLYDLVKPKEQKQPECFLFPNIVREDVWSVVKRCAGYAGLPQRVHPHTLRHCFATHLLNNGANSFDIAQLLGHSNVSTTATYTHLSSKKLMNDYSLLFDVPGSNAKDRQAEKEETELWGDRDKLEDYLARAENNQYMQPADVDIIIRRAENLKRIIQARNEKTAGQNIPTKTGADIVCQETYFNLKQSAAFLGICPITLKKLIKEKKIVSAEGICGRVISETELEKVKPILGSLLGRSHWHKTGGV